MKEVKNSEAIMKRMSIPPIHPRDQVELISIVNKLDGIDVDILIAASKLPDKVDKNGNHKVKYEAVAEATGLVRQTVSTHLQKPQMQEALNLVKGLGWKANNLIARAISDQAALLASKEQYKMIATPWGELSPKEKMVKDNQIRDNLARELPKKQQIEVSGKIDIISIILEGKKQEVIEGRAEIIEEGEVIGDGKEVDSGESEEDS